MPRGTPTTELVTALFTDIVRSTEIAGEVGDGRWRELVAAHHALVRERLKRHHGREQDTAGDGFFATFSRPAEAIRCAIEISEGVRELGLEIRAGLHLGEAEVMGPKVGGVAVNTAARIMACTS
jgi:class 3 adenylate cyclase